MLLDILETKNKTRKGKNREKFKHQIPSKAIWTIMEKEPLLPLQSPGRSSISLLPPQISLPPLPEDEEMIPPSPLITPSSLKDRLIFGPSFYSPAPDIPSPSPSAIFDSQTPAASSFLPPRAPCFDPPDPQRPSPIHTSPLSLRKHHLHRSKTAPAMAAINELHFPKVKAVQTQFTSQSIVRHGIILLLIYLALGISIYWINRNHFSESSNHPIVDALYFCIVTMCTIGYGDITPESAMTKVFSILFVLVGFGFIDILLSGMVSYVLDLQENYLLKAVKTGKDLSSILIDVNKGRMRIRIKVGLALGVVVICIGVGMSVMHFVEHLGWLDSLYLSVMSVTTVGYGDQAFKTTTGRIFASIWLLVSTLAVARAFLYLAEARVDRRHKMMAKCVLGEDMTVAQFLAADMDNHGFVSKSEFVLYKLKELGKVSDRDVLQICRKFEQIDAGNCGKITLADLMESHS